MLTDALIARELSGFTCTRSLTMNSKFSIPHSAKPRIEICRCYRRVFFNQKTYPITIYRNDENRSNVSELVQLNPYNSLAECVTL